MPKLPPRDELVVAAGETVDEFQSKRPLNPGQQRANVVLQGPQRHTALVGGARAGKTALFVRAIVIRALHFDKSLHAVLRLNNNAVWPSIGLQTFPWVMENWFPGVKYESYAHDYFAFENDSQIWLGGIDQDKAAEKILGREYATIFFNECSQIPYSSVVLALSRLAQKIPGLIQRAYYDLNPGGKGHWSNMLFGLKKYPDGKPLPNPAQYQRFFLNPKDNAANLTEEYLQELENMPTKQRQRFFEGIYQDETEDALWTQELLDMCRIDPRQQKLPDMLRVVVAVDPSGARSELDTKHDMIGILVVGLGTDGHGYVLADHTRLSSPKAWARTAIGAYHSYRADKIVAEVNFGGALVEAVIMAEDQNIPYKAVTASRGKAVRAAPVSTLYGDPQAPDIKKIRVHHVGDFPQLEEEMTAFTDLGYTGDKSPNRADALVWALTELMLGDSAIPWLQYWENEAAIAQGKPSVAQQKATEKAAKQRIRLIAPRPHEQFAPSKDRRYVSDVGGEMHEVTASGMIRGVHPEDVDTLLKAGCKVTEEAIL